MNAQLEDLIQRLTHQDGPEVRSSAQSVSFNAAREVEKIVDPAILATAKAMIVDDKNKERRRALYFIIGKVALNLCDSDTSTFLIQQIPRETDKYVLGALLDRIAELPKPDGTDLQPIFQHLEDRRWLVRHSAIQALRRAASPEAETALIGLLERSTDLDDIIYANATLNRIGSPLSIPALELHVGSRKRDVKLSAQLAIQAIRERQEAQQTPTDGTPSIPVRSSG